MACSTSATNTENVENKDFSQEYSLQDIFKQVIEGKPLEVDINNIKVIMKQNLMIDISNLKSKLQCVLPYMVVHFIRSWPGWQKSYQYFQKQITFENWFEKFKEYLSFKVAFFIKNYGKTLLTDEDYRFKTEGTQTSPMEKENSPFVLEIRGPPRILNSLVFCEGLKGIRVLFYL